MVWNMLQGNSRDYLWSSSVDLWTVTKVEGHSTEAYFGIMGEVSTKDSCFSMSCTQEIVYFHTIHCLFRFYCIYSVWVRAFWSCLRFGSMLWVFKVDGERGDPFWLSTAGQLWHWAPQSFPQFPQSCKHNASYIVCHLIKIGRTSRFDYHSWCDENIFQFQ